ncbi:hypothetical protein HDK77DRAFT_12929 [Phyllosticta capitalensis]
MLHPLDSPCHDFSPTPPLPLVTPWLLLVVVNGASAEIDSACSSSQSLPASARRRFATILCTQLAASKTRQLLPDGYLQSRLKPHRPTYSMANACCNAFPRLVARLGPPSCGARLVRNRPVVCGRVAVRPSTTTKQQGMICALPFRRPTLQTRPR